MIIYICNIKNIYRKYESIIIDTVPWIDTNGINLYFEKW